VHQFGRSEQLDAERRQQLLQQEQLPHVSIASCAICTAASV
jgi:hypothetical protein